MEEADKQAQEEEENRKQSIVEEEKAKLLSAYGNILKDYHPKASTQYGGQGFK
jgi:hypothetical protein